MHIFSSEDLYVHKMPSELRCLGILLVVTCLNEVFVLTQNVNGYSNLTIIRKDQDMFSDRLAASHTSFLHCKASKAKCIDYSCQFCQCPPTHPTYIRTRGVFGECVENNKVVYMGCKYECYVDQLCIN